MSIEDFWARVSTASSGCWLWTGARNAGGYGLFTIDGRRQYAHRISYADRNGPIPVGAQIDHKCHVKLCVRPDHLQAVSQSANLQNRPGPQANSKSGVRGVYWHQGKWRVQIRVDGRNVSGGVYTDLDQAAEVARSLRASLMPNSLLDLVSTDLGATA